MRIVAGDLKNKEILSPKDIRIVEAKTKKVLYDLIGDLIVSKEVLDLFAGIGSLGIEALSWGAGKAVFIEKDRHRYDIINKNLQKLNLLEKSEVFYGDAQEILVDFRRQERSFDLVFLDPPYTENIMTKSLKWLLAYDIVKPQSLVACLGFYKEKIEVPEEFKGIFLRRYGDRQVILLEKNESSLPRDI